MSSHEWTEVSIPNGESDERVVLASIETYNGDNTAAVRTRNVDSDGMEFFVEEEQSSDSETRHNREVVGFFSTEPGKITDQFGHTIGESEVVATRQADDDQWHSVSLDESYSNPVVFAQVMSYHGRNPCHTRIRNVGPDSFEFQIEEWEHLDGAHNEEEIGYVVLEAGVHLLSSGIPVEVGTTTTGHAWQSVDFTAKVGSDPVLITHCQTRNGEHEVVTRNRRVASDGAQVRLQEEEARGGQHTDETVGYLVLPQTLSQYTSERVASAHEWTDVNFSGAQPSESVVVASIDTYNGANPADVRMRNVSASGMQVFVEEEASQDNEMNHAEEVLGFFKTRTGPLFDSSGERVGETGVIRTDQPGSDQWHSVALDGRYSDPVVFAQVMSYEGTNPCHIRVQNVASDSFEFQIEEWDYLDGEHYEEEIGYIVLESGGHDLSGSGYVEVGTTDGTDSWTGLNFDGDVGGDPVVISRCQTYNGHNEVVTRHRQVTADGADVRLQEEQGRDGEHTTETIGYLVAPRTTADITTGTIEATEEWSSVGLSGIPSTEPVALASLQSFNGGNTVGVRLRDVGSHGMELFLEEETSGDDETAHTTEDVGIVATSAGAILDEKGEQIGEAGVVRTHQPAADHWHSCDLDESYSDPVVFAQVMSYNGSDPCHTRIRNVGSDSFEYKIEEWDSLNGAHIEESVGYVAIERGAHEIEGEVPIEVGTTKTDHTFGTVSFASDFQCNPVFLTHCQTHNGGDAVVTRNQAIRSDGAEVRLQEEEAGSATHTEETVGYLVTPQLILGNRRSVSEFHPSCHGFEFVNSFNELPDLPTLPGNLDDKIENIDARYGLCGGMALAALDFFLYDRQVPDTADDETPQSGPLFEYLWKRQMDTFDHEHTYRHLRKFVQFYLPTTFTRARSVEELRSLKRALDDGDPTVLGLVYVRAGDGNIWNNHQVLAYDYIETGDTTRIHVYDPNCPGDNNIEVRVKVKDQGVFDPRPDDEYIEGAQYRGGNKMSRDGIGTLNIIGLIHMDVPAQRPPHNL
ncbi:hypothetical protein C455_09358 [Haloferax larsenii JCM 13917]|nr:hypothetical protein C455_09358 [Haloferax larsenii JCM 13917]